MAQTLEPLAVREPDARRLLGGISRETIWKLRKGGKVASFTIGATRLYPLDGLRRFIEEQCATGGNPTGGRS